MPAGQTGEVEHLVGGARGVEEQGNKGGGHSGLKYGGQRGGHSGLK